MLPLVIEGGKSIGKISGRIGEVQSREASTVWPNVTEV